MIPLPHLNWFFSFLFGLLGALRLRVSLKKNDDRNLDDFFKIFVLVTTFFLFVSLPGLFKTKAVLVQISYILAWASLFPAPFLGLRILFNIWDLPRFKKACLPVGLLLMTIFIALSAIYFSPAKIRTLEGFYYWSEGTPAWLQASSGGIIGISVLLIAIFFLIEGLKSRNRTIAMRSFLVGGGFIILFLATLSAYVIFQLSSLLVVASGFLSLMGIMIIYVGINYKLEVN